MKNAIKIGNAGGFWGDDKTAISRQLVGGDLDYITIDYLAEITMSILRKQQLKNPELGYVTDFVQQIDQYAQQIADKNVKIIANAGGINPRECAKQVLEKLANQNIKIKVAIVEGDNIIDNINNLQDETPLKNMETGELFESIKNKVQSANVYLGVLPVVKALESGAQIVIAGRVTDTSITLAPMMYEFGWKTNEWDKLASGIVAGHIVECGAQASGGNFTDWQKVKEWDNIGYPVVEVHKNGNFTVTKHKNSGGLISTDTIKEQILYEMGNPKSYISPDVIADFSSIKLEAEGENRVKVKGIKGKPATHFYKVSIAYNDGYKSSGSIIVSAPNAFEKAKIFKDIFWKRVGLNYEKTNTEFVGYNASHKFLSKENTPNEILVKFDVYDFNRDKIAIFAQNIAPLILSGPPGVAVTGGRPRIQSVMTYWPALLPKKLITPSVLLFDFNGNIEKQFNVESTTGFEEEQPQPMQKTTDRNTPFSEWSTKHKTVRFEQICLARSGDKGDTVNIGVIARSDALYEFLHYYLTAKKMREMFISLCKGEVTRYELNNLKALNFLLTKSLDGGGTKSLMLDAQGKTFAQALLNQEVDIPENLFIPEY